MNESQIGFSPTKEQVRLRETAHELAREEIVPRAASLDATAGFPHEVIARASAVQLRNICVPKELGGRGLSILDGCFVVEELGWGCSGVANAFTVNEITSLPLIYAGNERQRKKWLGALVDGQLGTFALTEPNAGSDVCALTSHAARRGDEYILNGVKTLISNVTHSSFYLVFARTEASKSTPAAASGPQYRAHTNSREGITLFTVPKSSNGVVVTKIFDKMGQRTSDTGELAFHDVVIPQENRIGAEGEGFTLAMKAFGGARPWTAAAALGLGRRAMEESLRYAIHRKTFGQAIWKHQAVGHKLAEMDMGLEAARLLTWSAAWGVDRGAPNPKLLASAKTFAADVAMRICTDAVQIYGGLGYMKEYPVEKLMRDAKVFQIYDGTSEIQRNVIANELSRAFSRQVNREESDTLAPT